MERAPKLGCGSLDRQQTAPVHEVILACYPAGLLSRRQEEAHGCNICRSPYPPDRMRSRHLGVEFCGCILAEACCSVKVGGHCGWIDAIHTYALRQACASACMPHTQLWSMTCCYWTTDMQILWLAAWRSAYTC